jgi:hypothetical protein
MTLYRTFKTGEKVKTTKAYGELMRGETIYGVVVDEYESKQEISETGKTERLHLVEITDSHGVNSTINALWLE